LFLRGEKRRSCGRNAEKRLCHNSLARGGRPTAGKVNMVQTGRVRRGSAHYETNSFVSPGGKKKQEDELGPMDKKKSRKGLSKTTFARKILMKGASSSACDSDGRQFPSSSRKKKTFQDTRVASLHRETERRLGEIYQSKQSKGPIKIRGNQGNFVATRSGEQEGPITPC